MNHLSQDLIKSMELSPFWEVTSCAATQEIPNFLWNPKVLYHVHKRQPLAPVGHISPVHINPSWLSLRSVLILFTHLCHSLF